MKQRHHRKIIQLNIHARLQWVVMRRFAEVANGAPVGREFGSRDYDRLMSEDFEKKVGVFAPGFADLPHRNGGKGNSIN